MCPFAFRIKFHIPMASAHLWKSQRMLGSTLGQMTNTRSQGDCLVNSPAKRGNAYANLLSIGAHLEMLRATEIETQCTSLQ